MFTEGADKVIGKLLSLVDVSTDLANVALLTLGGRLRLDVCMVVRVGHSLAIRDNPRFRNGADEHTVCIKINVLLDLQGHEGIDIARQEHKTVVRAQRRTISKLIHVTAAAESK